MYLNFKCLLRQALGSTENLVKSSTDNAPQRKTERKRSRRQNACGEMKAAEESCEVEQIKWGCRKRVPRRAEVNHREDLNTLINSALAA